MAWTDFFVKELPSAKTVVSPDGRPYISMEIAPKEYVEVHLTTSANCNHSVFNFYFKVYRNQENALSSG